MTDRPADQAVSPDHDPPVFASDIATELEQLTAEFNDTYSDTVLLLARFVGAQRDAVDASIERVDPTGADVAVELPDGAPDRTRLAFARRAQTLEHVEGELYRMISGARAAAGDTTPFTRFEHEIAGTVGLATYITSVAAVTDIGPGLRQISFRGGLDTYASLGFDQFLWVMVPRAGAGIDDGFTMEQMAGLADGARPAAAYYTVRRWRPEPGELDMWFVIHDHGGALSTWAAHAQLGDRAALWGPRRSYDPPADTTSLLLVGDETALAGIAAIIDARDRDLSTHVVVETAEPDHLAHLPAGAGITTHWVSRDGDPPGVGTRLAKAVRELDLPTDGLYAFGAAESRQIAAVRAHLRHERWMPVQQVRMTGYWRRTR